MYDRMCRVMLLDTSCYVFYAAIIFGTVHDMFDRYEDGPTTSNLSPEKFSAMMRVYGTCHPCSSC